MLFKLLALIGIVAPNLLVHWGFVIHGVIYTGDRTPYGNIYLRRPLTNISKGDLLVQTGTNADEGSGTSVLKRDIREPYFPAVSVRDFSERFMSEISARPTAKDVYAHLEKLGYIPDVPQSQIMDWIREGREFLFNSLHIEDRLADELKYGGELALMARTEAFFECHRTLWAKHFKYNKTFDREDQFYLLLFGGPAATTALSNRHLIKYDDFGIEAETNIPEFIEGKDIYESMMLKLITLELFCYYPFTSVYPFAPNLQMFEQAELFGHLKTIIEKTKNKRLRRNAIFFMGTIQKYEPLQYLFNILKTTTDNIEKARALYFLTLNGYPGLTNHLMEELKKEKDPVFKVAFINSLGQLKEQEVFPLLVEMLAKEPPDFELYYTLVRSAIICMDRKNEDVLKRFTERCEELLSDSHETDQWLSDPESRYGIIEKDHPQGAGSGSGGGKNRGRGAEFADVSKLSITSEGSIKGTRDKLLKELLTLAIASAEEKGREAVTVKRQLEEVVAETLRDEPAQEPLFTSPSPLTKNGWDTLTGGAVVNSAPSISGEKPGQRLLESLLFAGKESHEVLLAAVDSYYRNFTGEFEALAQKILLSDAYLYIKERALKYIAGSGSLDSKIEKYLEKVVKMFNGTEDIETKHLTTLALFYAGMYGRLKDSYIINTLKREISGQQNNDYRFEPNPDILKIKLKPESQLARVAIEILGITGTRKAEKYLLELLEERRTEIRRSAARALAGFNSKKTKEALLDSLADPDGWVRIFAYQSLRKTTGKEHRVDWFFSDLELLKKEIKSYKSGI